MRMREGPQGQNQLNSKRSSNNLRNSNKTIPQTHPRANPAAKISSAFPHSATPPPPPDTRCAPRLPSSPANPLPSSPLPETFPESVSLALDANGPPQVAAKMLPPPL